jgi:hypothetical protein
VIAGPYPASVRIIRSWPGPQTGDSYYETEDGRVWVTTSSSSPPITGVTYASVEGDQMVYPPRARAHPPPPPRIEFFDRPKPLPAPEEVSLAPEPTRRPKARLAPPASFVGAGPMHRRWR